MTWCRHHCAAWLLASLMLFGMLLQSKAAQGSLPGHLGFLFDTKDAIYWQPPQVWYPTGETAAALHPSETDPAWWRFHWDGQRWLAQPVSAKEIASLKLDPFNAIGLEQIIASDSEQAPWRLLFSDGRQVNAYRNPPTLQASELLNTDEAIPYRETLHAWTSDGLEPMSSSANLLVGHSAGSFRVDESGAATYHLPLSLPDGIAGVQPELGLLYSSHGGDGYLGRGWQLTGQAAISRCPKNLVQDGSQHRISLSRADRLCLNGQRLVSDGRASDVNRTDNQYWTAASYHTEIDEFLVVRAHGGNSQSPRAFTVETKSGEIHYYGDVGAVSGNDSMGRSLALSLQRYGGSTETSTDAVLESASNSAVVRHWALKAVRDVKGNYILYRYHKDVARGEHYLSAIQYTGRPGRPPFAEVSFEYENNPKISSGWYAGQKVLLSKLLSNINIRVDGSWFRQYRLNYFASHVLEEKNYLLSVQECADNGNTGCFPALRFDWQRPPPKSTSTVERCVNEPGAPTYCWQEPVTENFQPFLGSFVQRGSSVDRAYQQLIDMDGDGFADMVYVRDGRWRIRRGNSSFSYNNEQTLAATGANKRQFMQTIDYYGNGQRALLVANGASHPWHIMTLEPSTSTHTVCEPNGGVHRHCEPVTISHQYKLINTGLTAHGLEGQVYVADVDGDGLEDILFIRNGRFEMYRNLGLSHAGEHLGFSHQTNLGTVGAESFIPGQGFVRYSADLRSAAMLDVNGNGKTDLIVQITQSQCSAPGFERNECLYEGHQWLESRSWKLFTSTGNQYVEAQTLGDADILRDLRVVDLNGDGYTDLVYRIGTTWHYRLSNGNQFLPPRSTGLSTSNQRAHLTHFLDLNQDGRADILLPIADNRWAIFLSRPSLTHEQVIFEKRGERTFDSGASIQFADVDGDGKLDLLTATNDSGWKIYRASRPGIQEHVIRTFHDSFGVQTEVTYVPMTNSQVYFRQDSSQRVNGDYLSPRAGITLVSRVRTQVQPSHWLGVRYQYGGLLLHRKGRGMLGFEVLRTTDEQSGIVTETQYHQRWPFTGMPKVTSQYYGEHLLSQATNQLTNRSTHSGGRYVYVSSSEELSNQLDSDGNLHALSRVVSTFIQNAHGNLTSSTIRQYDPHNEQNSLRTDTTNTYGDNNPLYQRYGRLTLSVVRKRLYENGSVSSDIRRSSSFSYNNDFMLETEELAPDNAKYRHTTSYHYNAAGLITRQDVTAGINASGSEQQTRSNTTEYEGRFRFVSARTDAAGLRTTYRYNDLAPSSVTGRIISVRSQDANNQISKVHFNVLGQERRRETKGQASSDPWVARNTEQRFCSDINCSAVPGAYLRIRSFGAGQPEQRQWLDRFGRQIEQQTQLPDGSWSLVRLSYNNQGQLEKEYVPGKGVQSLYFNEYSYDNFGRLKSTNLASGGSEHIRYLGYLTRYTDARGRHRRVEKNYLGQTVISKEAANNYVQFSYNAYGQVLTTRTYNHVGGARSNRQTIEYDIYGRKINTIDQDTGEWTYSHNAFGELLSQTDAKGQVTLWEYDSAGRQVRRRDPSGTTCWTYGTSAANFNRGQLTRVRSFSSSVACSTTSTPVYQETYSYNSRALLQDKLIQTLGQSHRFGYRYDSSNRLAELDYPAISGSTPALTVRTEYDYGTPVRWIDNNTGRIYQRHTHFNSRGQVTTTRYANGARESRVWNDASGWLDYTEVQLDSNLLYSAGYQYDLVGNTEERTQQFGIGHQSNFKEVFSYDTRYRLRRRTISNLGSSSQYNSLPASMRMSQEYSYNHRGGLMHKEGTGHYKYHSSIHHRLTGIWQNSDHTGTRYYNFSYDNNGNVTSDGRHNFTYTAFNKPSRITQGSDQTEFWYGPNRELYRQRDVRGGEVTDSLLLDGLYERVQLPGGVIEHKFRVGNAQVVQRSNNTSSVHYFHSDGLGSTVAVTSQAKNVLQQLTYDPWGRQYAVHTRSVMLSYSLPGDSRGYTGHRMVKGFEVVHMGGRTYNPFVGRFMQPDPFIQAPLNMQNYNRYSYVLNNPMSYTDPSGYNFVKKALKGVMEGTGTRKVLRELGRNQYLNAAVQIGVCMAGGPVVCGVYAGAQSFAMTGSLGAGLRTGLITFGTAWTIQQIGGSYSDLSAANVDNVVFNGTQLGNYLDFGGNLLTAGQVAGQIFSHAMVGGVSTSLQGGKFGHGFFSAGVTKGLGTPLMDASFAQNVVGGTVISATIGGTASVIAGGKFANGAVTGAMQALYNQYGRWQRLKSWMKDHTHEINLGGDFTIMWGDQGTQIGVSLGGGEDGLSLSFSYAVLNHHSDNPLLLKSSYYVGVGGFVGGSLSEFQGSGFLTPSGLNEIYTAGGGLLYSGGLSAVTGPGYLGVGQARGGYGLGMYFSEGTQRTKTFRWNW